MKEFDIVIQMTLERVLVQRSKKKKRNEPEKLTFKKDMKIISCGRMIYLEFILT